MKIHRKYIAFSLARLTVLTACIMALSPLVIVAEEQVSVYSTTSNSGTRGTVCITLEGTHAENYYTAGDYIYEVLDDLDADALLASLRELMTDTHTVTSAYADSRDYASKTDCQNEDGTISLLYTGYNAAQSDFIGSGSVGWNREHVWPKSLGGFGNDGAGADLHHVRPDDVTTNAARGNLKYGDAAGGSAVKGSALVDGMVGGTKGGGYFEPLDHVKGDVARICLYLYVRYGTEYAKCSSINNVFESVDVLLEWCALDPVDTWEMGRNEVVAAMQGNRNVFIDYPEYAWLIFDREIPADMITPSGMAKASGDVSETESESVSVTETESTPVGESESTSTSETVVGTETNTDAESVTASDTVSDTESVTGMESGSDTETNGGCGASVTAGVTAMAMIILLPVTVALRKRKQDE